MYKIVFVVLVYRNTEDLKNFFLSNHLPNTKTIVVNSFYDEATENSFRSIAYENDADFLSVPNKGYGAGNNIGVEYALNNYDFNYLIISNADITIENFQYSELENYNNVIIAPNIINARGKQQNPCSPFKPTFIEVYLRYLTYKKKLRKVMTLFYIFSRIKKNIFFALYPLKRRIFSAHGAFVVFPKEVLVKLVPLYNERMFLFGEETHLALKAKINNITTHYAPKIIIRHKEDGSMKVASVDVFEKERESFIALFDYWYKKNK